MMDSMRRLFAAVLALMMTVSCLPAAALAQEVPEPQETMISETTQETEETEAPQTTEAVTSEPTEETAQAPTEESLPEPTAEKEPDFPETEEENVHISVDAGLDMTPQERYAGYARSVLYGQETAAAAAAGDALTDDARKLYDGMLPFLKAIADGERSSSIITYGRNDADIDLDPDCLTEDEVHTVWWALMADYPYDTYWWTSNGLLSSQSGNRLMALDIGSLYRDPYTTLEHYYVKADTTKTARARQAERNARDLVKQYADLDDYEKLLAYSNWIADNVRYDYDAFIEGSEVVGYGPWTAVSVFDKDPSTNVVCGGYAAALQYIYDMSTFQNMKCYTMLGFTTGYHGWNIVELDGARYLVDLTAYDTDRAGDYDYRYFLAGAKPDPDGWYPIGGWAYQHEAYYVKQAFGTEELDLSPSYYAWKLDPDTPHILRVAVDGVDMTNKTIQIPSGTTLQLDVTVYPETASQDVVWQMNAGDYFIDISDTGLVTAKRNGTTSVKIRSAVWAEYAVANFYIEVVGESLGEDLSWSIADGVLTIGGTGTVLPDFKAEEAPWADQAQTITRVVLPQSVEHVYTEAFSALPNLTALTASVTAAQDILPEITTLVDVTVIGDQANKVRVPESAFQGNQYLRSISLPECVESIGNSAFSGCSNLETLVLPETLESIGYGAFANCDLKTITMPKTIDTLFDGAFSGNGNLERIVIPEGITELPRELFRNCTRLKEVVLPSTLTRLKDFAFQNCTSLKQITLPENLNEIYGWPFDGCTNLESVVVSEGVVTINGFSGCAGLKNVSLPSTLKTIEGMAFENCTALETITLPEGLETLGSGAFQGSGLKTISIPASLALIPEFAFSECTALTSAVIPGTVKTIERGAFRGCTSLTSLTLEAGVEKVSQGAFANCGLTHVTIPASVKILYMESLEGNKNLKSVYFEGDKPQFAGYAFSGPVTVYYPAGNRTWERSSDPWADEIVFVPVSAHDHVWDEGTVITAPTCFTTGLKQVTCALCPAVSEQILPFAHQESVIPGIPADCTEPGVKDAISCTLCGKVLQTADPIPALGHDPQIVGGSQPTCTEDGYTGDSKCARCGEVYETGSSIPALGHDHVMETIPRKKPTSTETGYDSFQVLACTRCDLWFHEDKTAMTGQQMEEKKQENIRYASAKSVSITLSTGDAVPRQLNITACAQGLSLKAAVSPAAAQQKVNWKSGNEKIAEVDENGHVTLHKTGKVTITATAEGSGRKTSVKLDIVRLVEGLEITGSAEVAVGKSIALKAVASPEDATTRSVSWSSSDTSVAKVSSSGKITAKKGTEGKTVTITATAKDGSGVTAVYTVTVCPAVKTVQIQHEGGDVSALTHDWNLGDTLFLTAKTLEPEASDGVSWKSSSTKIAEVDKTGKVTVHKTGKATITATAADGSGKKDTLKLTVVRKVKTLDIDGAEALTGGKSLALKAVAAPADATEKAVTWTSSDEIVAKVSRSGKVTAKRVETKQQVTITATAKDGGNAAASVTLWVYPAAKEVQILLDGTPVKTLELGIGETLDLDALVLPGDADQSAAWKSSSRKTAAVDKETGTVTGIKAGTVTITATAANGKKTTCKVRVVKPADAS